MYKGVYDTFARWFNDKRGGIWFYSDPHFGDQEMMWLRKNYIGDDEQVKKIHAHIVLILGNHDAGATTYKGYADEVYEGPLFISDKILLSHEPIVYPYGINIHGHDHSNWYYTDNQHLNMCAEHINYTPVSLCSIIQSGVLKNISNIHRAIIDDATARKHKN